MRYKYIDTASKDNWHCTIISSLGEHYLIKWETGGMVWRKKDKIIKRKEIKNE